VSDGKLETHVDVHNEVRELWVAPIIHGPIVNIIIHEGCVSIRAITAK
jgi:hypothetical protein